MLKMVLKSKWPVYINKSIENLKFPMIWLDYYLGQTLNIYLFVALEGIESYLKWYGLEY